jgi:hypothetical protein
MDTVTTQNIIIDLAYPPGWVQLPVGWSKQLEPDKRLSDWAADKARSLLGPKASPQHIAKRTDDLAALTITCRARRDRSGFAFFPDDQPELIAMLDVKRMTPEHDEVSFDSLKEIFASYTPAVVGDIESSMMDLTSGPALRVRRKQVEEPDEHDQGTLTESVTYAIRPPGFGSAAIMIMTWTLIEVGDELAAMADAIAKTIRISPA